MINLYNTTDKMQVITGSAVTVDVVASYVDLTVSGGTFSDANRQVTAISTAATTDIVAAPASGKVRNVKTMLIRNKHASASVVVTVQYNANGTLYQMHACTLFAGDCLQYIDGIGFYLLTAATRLNTILRVASDIIYNTAATLADVTGLTVPVKNGKNYTFLAQLFHLSAATTTGAQFGVNGPSMTSLILANISGVTNSVAAGAISLGSATALNTVVTAQTTGSSAITLTVLSGAFTPSADGTFAIRATAEVAANMTVKQGSWCQVRESDN